jgi:hypothetical protein
VIIGEIDLGVCGGCTVWRSSEDLRFLTIADPRSKRPPGPSKKLLQKPGRFNNSGSPFSVRIPGVSTPLEPDSFELLAAEPAVRTEIRIG